MQFADFLKSIDLDEQGTLSPLWREIIGSARQAFDQLRATGKLPSELPKKLSYDFLPANRSTRERWRKAERLAKKLKQSMKLARADLGELDEDVASLMFLRASKVIEPYYAMLEEFGRAHNMQTARQFCYATAIRDWVRRYHSRPVDVLEIGGGAGVLARLLDHMGVVRTYTGVDIPPMLAIFGAVLDRDGHEATFDEPLSDAKFRLLLPDTLAGVPAASFDLMININSFPEIEKDQVERYLSEIGRTAREGAILYTVNRIQTHADSNGGHWQCNPILLPYPAGEVLFHQPDPFQASTRGLLKMRHDHSFAMTRVSRVRSKQ